MNYTVNIEGFEGRDIEVIAGFWAGPKLMVNGQPAEKGARRGEMILQRNDGKQVAASWKPQVLGMDVPQLVVDGRVINLVEPLKWYQLVWGGWPVVLIFMGGALGGIAGALGFILNTRIFRSGLSDGLKYLVTGAVAVLSVIAYLVMALIFTLLVTG